MAHDQDLKLWNIKPRNIKQLFHHHSSGKHRMQNRGIVIVFILFRLHLTVAWTAASVPFNIDFDVYDLEMKVSGNGDMQFDIHGTFGGHIEFNLNSYSSTFPIYMPCGGTSQISNVPVPATNVRVWRMEKTSIVVTLYCDEILVGHFSKSSSTLSCLSNDQWNSFGQNFQFVDDAVTHYRFITSEL